MHLHEFIRSRMEPIVAEWEAFARTLTPGADTMDRLALRDHAQAMLRVIADDMETYQSERARGIKSRGEVSPAVRATAATIHGGLRFDNQFSMIQLAAEFRALRATVLRLWLADDEQQARLSEEVIRFNEAIDQALAESIDAFVLKSNNARELFLGVLGHDLRAPLATIGLAGETLMRGQVGVSHAVELGGNLKRATYHMGCLIENLIGYTRLQLGAPMPLRRIPVDLSSICRDALRDAEATFRGCRANLHVEGDVTGEFDPVAIRQLMTNLFVNAAQHGARGGEIGIELRGSDADVTLEVGNDGEPIPAAVMASMFQPLVRAAEMDGSELAHTSFGLGLFIAREVARSHGGDVQATSTAAGRTTFRATLPKSAAGA